MLPLLSFVVLAFVPPLRDQSTLGRRTALTAAAAAAVSSPRRVLADEAPPFDWTFLYSSATPADTPKQTGLSLSALATILEHDLNNKYPLTGALTEDIFRDDCRFVDPNNAVNVRRQTSPARHPITCKARVSRLETRARRVSLNISARSHCSSDRRRASLRTCAFALLAKPSRPIMWPRAFSSFRGDH